MVPYLGQIKLLLTSSQLLLIASINVLSCSLYRHRCMQLTGVMAVDGYLRCYSSRSLYIYPVQDSFLVNLIGGLLSSIRAGRVAEMEHGTSLAENILAVR